MGPPLAKVQDQGGEKGQALHDHGEQPSAGPDEAEADRGEHRQGREGNEKTVRREDVKNLPRQRSLEELSLPVVLEPFVNGDPEKERPLQEKEKANHARRPETLPLDPISREVTHGFLKVPGEGGKGKGIGPQRGRHRVRSEAMDENAARPEEARTFFAPLRRDRALRWILLLSLLLRLAYSFLLFPVIGERLHWKGVDDGYDEIARNLLHQEGFVNRPGDLPNLVTPPGYPFFLYLLYQAVGEEVNEGPRIQIVHSLLDTLTCYLIYLLGLRLFRQRSVALLASFAWACYPQIIVYNARLAPEVLFICLVTTMMLLWVELLQRGRWRDALLVGVAWGLAVLVKEKLIFFPPLLLLLVLRRPWEWRRRALLVAVALAAMLFTVLPWMVRGVQVTGGFVPITLRSGRALNQGMDESFTGADDVLVEFFQNRPEAERAEKRLPVEGSDEEVRESARSEKSLVRKALSRIAADPAAYLRAFVVKLGAFWYYGQPKVIAGNIVVQIPILLLAVAGYIRGWKRFPLAPFLVLTLYFLLLHALTIVRMRYSLPVMPENLLLASFFLVDSVRRRRSAQETRS